ncbi:MAG: signal recognition particle protein [Alphaproteobacteria bacterium]|nr:signal recognition particle protein [Alphaproteobacteria bacterium]
MFQNLSQRLSDVFSKLTRKGALTEEDVNTALREVRIALLEADVALPVVKEFVESVKAKAVGQEVIRSISPGQMVIKIVSDHLVEVLGGASEGLDLAASPPVVVMMVGLQGSGKTTTSGKLALRLLSKHRKKALLASLDVNRPAAQEQLAVVAKQAGTESLPIVPGQKPLEITQRALKEAKLGGYDVLILDTAGRLHIDDELMAELAAVRDLANPKETLLVADSLTGQDAVNVARQFNEKIGVTGIVLTRIDGDGRGGAALSMRQVTGRPIKFLGTGEKLEGLEEFHPERVASRILDMGDVVSLVERAVENIDKEAAEKMAVKALEGQFDLDDMAAQFKQIKKLGGLGGMLTMLPGMGKMKQQLEGANIDEKMLARQEAIISSMTKKERKHPKLLNASRRRRIALGAGVEVQDVNRLLKQHQQMADMMKKVKKMGKKGLLRGGLKGLLPG